MPKTSLPGLTDSLICFLGIGKAIASKLAQQGLNVVLVALQDPLLDEAYEELKQKCPSVQLRKVGHLNHTKLVRGVTLLDNL